MNLFNRLRRKTPDPIARKAPIRVLPSRLDEKAQWAMVNLESYVADGFERNAVIYSAIMYKVRAQETAPLRAYVGTLEQPTVAPREHPLAALVARPNPWMSRREFQSYITVCFNLAGNAWIYMDRPKPATLPTAMYALRPDCMAIIPNDQGGIKGYLYTPDGKDRRNAIPFLPQDVMHVKLPHPGDPLNGLGFGLSPITALAQSGDVDNQVTDYLKRFFQNGTMFQGILKIDAPLSDTQIADIRRRWQETYGGSDKFNQIGVLDQLGEYQRLSPTFDEMGFESIDERNEARMLGPFGVPSILIGARVGLKHSTYSNYEQARRAFWQDTLVPEIGLFEEEYQYYLNGEDGAFVRFDLSDVPALRQDVVPLVDAAHKLWQMGTPAALAYATVGLNVPTFPTADQGFLPGTVIPAGAPVEMDAETTEETNDNADSTEDEREKALIAPRRFKAFDPDDMALKVDRSAVSWEPKFGTAAESAFEADKREVLALVGETAKAARLRKAGIDWRFLERSISEYLNDQGAENWRDQFIPLIEGAMNDSAKEWASALGVRFNVRNLRGEAWFQDYMLKFSKPINDTTSQGIKDVIAQALKEGWSNKQMEDRLGLLFDQWMKGNLSAEDFAWFEKRLPAWRREAIARTESMHASNAGAAQHFKEWGVEEKSWLATGDDRTRPAHAAANGQRRPIDEPFEVGGAKMMYPLDGSLGAPASEIVDCRCTVVPEGV